MRKEGNERNGKLWVFVNTASSTCNNISGHNKKCFSFTFQQYFLGAVILFNGNVFYAVPALFRDFLFKQAADGYNASVIVLVFLSAGWLCS